MKKIMSALLCTITVVMSSITGFAYNKAEEKLVIPSDATVILITEDNFDEYFEDVKVKGEYEYYNLSVENFSNVWSNNVSSNVYAPAWNGDGELHAVFDIQNELWLISPIQALDFGVKNEGPYSQINGIYDAVNNVLYHSTNARTCSDGYIFYNFRENGSVSIVKYEVTKIGFMSNETVYKLTYMTGRFKKLPYVTVSYNNELITFDQKPVVENGRTLVPLRAIFEKIGADVTWDGNTQTVTATKDDTTVSLTINNTTAYKNGVPITLDVPAKSLNGRTLVPVRFISDCFGVNVNWDGAMRRVVLTK